MTSSNQQTATRNPISPLLSTKFLAQRQPRHAFPRPHLVERLERDLDKRLILISAPPGYGKTTLLSQLTSAAELRSAWVQLDADDSDPTIFLSYLIEALRRIHSGVENRTRSILGNAASALLQSADAGQAAAPERVLVVLINELAEAKTDDWYLILEDYHLIANPAVHSLVDYLLENAPPSLHLLISTRVDPPLALARLRARGMLAEIRTADLRFSHDEVC